MANDMAREFEGLWIPAALWLNPDFSITEKAFIAEIKSLKGSTVGCFASNSYLSDFFKISKRHVMRHLEALEKKSVIRIEKKDGQRRRIFLTMKISDDKIVIAGDENVTGEVTEPSPPCDENVTVEAVKTRQKSSGNAVLSASSDGDNKVYNKVNNKDNTVSPIGEMPAASPVEDDISTVLKAIYEIRKAQGLHMMTNGQSKGFFAAGRKFIADVLKVDTVEQVIGVFKWATKDKFWGGQALTPQHYTKLKAAYLGEKNREVDMLDF